MRWKRRSSRRRRTRRAKRRRRIGLEVKKKGKHED